MVNFLLLVELDMVWTIHRRFSTIFLMVQVSLMISSALPLRDQALLPHYTLLQRIEQQKALKLLFIIKATLIHGFGFGASYSGFSISIVI